MKESEERPEELEVRVKEDRRRVKEASSRSRRKFVKREKTE